MISRYNNISLAVGIPGLVLQVVGRFLVELSGDPQLAPVGALIILVGTGFLLVGFAYYAMAKGRSPWWCLVAFLSCLGLLVLATLKDLTKTAESVTPETGLDNATPRPDSGNPYQSPPDR